MCTLILLTAHAMMLLIFTKPAKPWKGAFQKSVLT